MKRIVVFLILVNLSSPSFSQQTDSKSTVHDRAFYLAKSKNQKSTAWVFLIGGAVVAGAGVIVSVSDLCIGCAASEIDHTGNAITTIGALTSAASIPFFVFSAINKSKANNLSAFFKIDHIPFATPGTFARVSSPTATIRIRLN